MAEQRQVTAVHLVHKGRGIQESLRLLSRLYRLPRRHRRSGRDAHPAQAFTDFVEVEDLDAKATREKNLSLRDYATTQTKIGGLVRLDELSEIIDEDNPKAFAEFARVAAYGLSLELPIDKRTINQFRRFTGQAEGLSISFEFHLLGNKVEFDQADNTLTLRGLPAQLKDQFERTK